MKLLIIISSLDNGGTENHLLKTLPVLVEKGLDITVYSLKPGGIIAGGLREKGVTVFEPGLVLFEPVQSLVLMVSIIRVLFRVRPDIVHFFLPKAYLIGGLAALLIPVRRVMSRRSLGLYQKKRPVAARVERFLHRRMDNVLGNADAVIKELRAEGIPESRLRLIYNGVAVTDVPERDIRDRIRQELGIPDNAFVMIYVANLITYKGHADLLNAVVKTQDTLPEPWRLLCVGRDDGMMPALQEQIDQADIAGHVLFTGERTYITEMLAAVDLGIMTSHQEGFSNSLLEKMAAGLPVVATDVGGNREAIIDNESGLLVPPHDPDALGAAIARLAADPALRRRLGENARARVRECFSIERCAEAYLQLYTDLM